MEKYIIPDVACTYHGFNQITCTAFAKGCGGKLLPVNQTGNCVATYGILRGSDRAIKKAKQFWYIDHGYIGGKNEYWRITKNDILHSGKGEYPIEKLINLNIHLKKWKKDGRYVLICPPGKYMHDFLGLKNWLTKIILEIRKYTDREILISRKKDPPPTNPQLYSHLEYNIPNVPLHIGLKNAWILVTDHSNAMTDALINGIPIICTNENRRIGSISQIESPMYNRNILIALAANQWTLEEIKNGKAWRELNEYN